VGDRLEPGGRRAREENAKLHGVEERVHVVEGDLLDPLTEAVDLVVANLPYLSASSPTRATTTSRRSGLRSRRRARSVRRLLNACRDGKLETGGTLLIQFHREPLAANCWELEDLREQLEASA